ncbi:hypothetical protein CYMTET_10250 [Cymbomonas tetramitiformis]|uniref:Uncharacterized protein n=1 Tax=Cymbomonas tetramitiformis TaxID=36881 RepID=A0AAE0GPP2_9CHLO|nr:hypothetical protein CYMTET_10250 [Cymbomonas tetramitiformis]
MYKTVTRNVLPGLVGSPSISPKDKGGRAFPLRVKSGGGGPIPQEDEEEFDEDDYCAFMDIDTKIIDFLTFKSLQIVLKQISETDVSPGKQEYNWLYTFATENKPSAGDYFIRDLFHQRPDFAERILATRISLFSRWTQCFSPEHMYETLQERNTALMRERLMSTINMTLELDDDARSSIDLEEPEDVTDEIVDTPLSDQ